MTLQDLTHGVHGADLLTSDAYAYDYRGRPRSLTVSAGLVSADNGRCSDVGAPAGPIYSEFCSSTSGLLQRQHCREDLQSLCSRHLLAAKLLLHKKWVHSLECQG